MLLTCCCCCCLFFACTTAHFYLFSVLHVTVQAYAHSHTSCTASRVACFFMPCSCSCSWLLYSQVFFYLMFAVSFLIVTVSHFSNAHMKCKFQSQFILRTVCMRASVCKLSHSVKNMNNNSYNNSKQLQQKKTKYGLILFYVSQYI